MRLYPWIHIVAIIALVSGARLAPFSKNELRARNHQATDEASWLTAGDWWQEFNVGLSEDFQCAERANINKVVANFHQLCAADSVFYSCIAIAGLYLFVVLKFIPFFAGLFAKQEPEQQQQQQETEMPSLSIFQLLGILEELRKNRKDLSDQMESIAGNNQELLSRTLGENNSFRSRTARLKDLLCSALKREGIHQSRGAKALLFFLELEEDEQKLWCIPRGRVLNILAIVVLCQTIFPVYLVWDGWKEFYCSTLGSTPIYKDKGAFFRTIAKIVLVMIVFLCIWQSHSQKIAYALNQRYRFPHNLWTRGGDFVTALCTLITAIAANTIIWVPQNLLSVVGYALVVLALYHFNEIIVYAIIRNPDSFQQWVAHDMIQLLEACPLSIEDLVKKDATQDVNLFVIETIQPEEGSYKLLTLEKNQCETRVQVSIDDIHDTSSKVISVKYRRAVQGCDDQQLPPNSEFWVKTMRITQLCLLLPCLLSVLSFMHAFNLLGVQVPTQ